MTRKKLLQTVFLFILTIAISLTCFGCILATNGNNGTSSIVVTRQEYTVTFDSNGGSEVSAIAVLEGWSILEPSPAPTKKGYVFDKWCKNIGLTAVFHFGIDAVSSDITLYAKWERDENFCIVSFNSNGGSAVADSIIKKGEKIVEPSPAPTRATYIFIGWYKDADLKTSFVFDTMPVDEDVTLHAKWEKDEPVCTVGFDSNGGSAVSNETIEKGGKISAPNPAPTKEGYYFIGWYKDADLINAFDFDAESVTKSMTLYARWVEITTGSEGLAFELSESGDEYSVVGLDTVTDTDIVIPSVYNGKLVTDIGNHAFYNNRWLTNITIPASVVSIGDYAFSNCTSLASIIIPDSVAVVGEYAFYNCTSARIITIPYSVTTMKSYAFSSCNSVANITIPASVTVVGEYAFYNCTAPIYVEVTKKPMSWVPSWTGYSVATVWDFLNNEIADDGNIYYTFDGIIYALKDTVATVIVQPKNITVAEIASSITYKGKTYNVTKIAENAFRECLSLSGVNIPVGIKDIGSYAFYRCESLTNITIPNGIESIGTSMFKECRSLVSVTLPESLASIGTEAFSECRSLASITLPENLTVISATAFRNCNSLTSITIPQSVGTIGSSAFSGCASLVIYAEASSAPSGWNMTNYSAVPIVWNCKSNDIAQDQYIRYIHEGLVYALKGGVAAVSKQSQSITSATIASNVTYNGTEYPVTSIAEQAFYECFSLASINIPDSVTSIGSYAFNRCESLTRITIPSGVTDIDVNAFNLCSALVIYAEHSSAPDGWVNGWNSRPVVWDCNNNDAAANGNLYYTFNGIIYLLKDGVASVAVQPRNINSATIASSVTYKGTDYPVTAIGTDAFANCDALTSIIIPYGVTSIGYEAFSSCSSLVSVTIPDSVTSIGYGAFSYCASLVSVNIPESVTVIGGEAFFRCAMLKSIIIPSGVTIISSDSFSNCTSLVSVVFAYGINLTSIGSSAFSQCDALKKIDIPYGVTTIGSSAFSHCGRLKNITIPDSVTTIGIGAFRYCISLERVILPNSLTAIGNQAFQNCTSLTSIVLSANVVSIGSNSFQNCTLLTIYAEAADKQDDWSSEWNTATCTVVWGCTLSEDGTYVESFTPTANGIENADELNGVSAPYRKGYVFGGWAESQDSETADYTSENVHTATEGITLYAIWIQH